MSVLDPLSHALAGVVAGAHDALTSLGADPSSGPVWLLSIVAVVVVVRLALLPLVVRGVRQAHAAARARPALHDLTQRFRNRKDADSVRALMAERRQISADHGLSGSAACPCSSSSRSGSRCTASSPTSRPVRRWAR